MDLPAPTSSELLCLPQAADARALARRWVSRHEHSYAAAHLGFRSVEVDMTSLRRRSASERALQHVLWNRYSGARQDLYKDLGPWTLNPDPYRTPRPPAAPYKPAEVVAYERRERKVVTRVWKLEESCWKKRSAYAHAHATWPLTLGVRNVLMPRSARRAAAATFCHTRSTLC